MVARAMVGLVLLAGCAHTIQNRYVELIHPPDLCREESPASLTRDQLRLDFDLLERTIRRGYAGFPIEGTEEEWSRVFAEGRTRIEAPMSGRAFRDLLVDHFRFIDDNHVGFWIYADGERDWRGISGHHQAYVADLRLEEVDGEYRAEGDRLLRCGDRSPSDVVRPVLGPEANIEWRPLLLSREPVEEMRCTFEADGTTSERTLPLTKISLGARRDAPYRLEQEPFPWIRLRTLVMSQEQVLETFVDSAAQVRDAPVVVLDLRRAGGGSDRFLIRWFASLTNQDLGYWIRGRLMSEVVLQGALNFWECVRATRPTPTSGDSWVDQRIDRAYRELDDAKNDRGLFYDLDPRQSQVFGDAPHRFGGRLLVLVDRGCQSACETALLLARQVEGAIIVGENSGGVMKVGEMRRYRLPNSRVYFSLGHQSHQDPEGHFRESYGFLPDLWLDGTDTDRDVQALVACLQREDCPLHFR